MFSGSVFIKLPLFVDCDVVYLPAACTRGIVSSSVSQCLSVCLFTTPHHNIYSRLMQFVDLCGKCKPHRTA